MAAWRYSRPAVGIFLILWLAGAAPALGQGVWTDNGSTVSLTDSTNRVGIGISAPVKELHGRASSGWFGFRMEGQAGFGATVEFYSNATALGDIYATPEKELKFRTNGTTLAMTIDENQNVGIGTAAPQSKLAVDGTITAKEVKVTSTGWPDYVFADDYDLMPLSALAAYIQANGHLPEVPSAEEVATNGLSLGASQALLLKKIEELTLYMIAMQQENEGLKERVMELERN